MDEGKKVKRSTVASRVAVYICTNTSGELVCLIQFPDTDDVAVTEYAVKTKKGFRNGIL